MAETWIINENPTLEDISSTISFESNGRSYNSILIVLTSSGGVYQNNSISYRYGSGKDDFTTVYTVSWRDQEYRTVTFETEPTGNLLTWLQSNAIKQVTNPKYLDQDGLSLYTEKIKSYITSRGYTKPYILKLAVSQMLSENSAQLTDEQYNNCINSDCIKLDTTELGEAAVFYNGLFFIKNYSNIEDDEYVFSTTEGFNESRNDSEYIQIIFTDKKSILEIHKNIAVPDDITDDGTLQLIGYPYNRAVSIKTDDTFDLKFEDYTYTLSVKKQEIKELTSEEIASLWEN